jgi:hypothetical protein
VPNPTWRQIAVLALAVAVFAIWCALIVVSKAVEGGGC